MSVKIKNSAALTATLSEVLISLKNGEIDVQSAKTIAQVADKINKNNINQLHYKRIMKSEEKIEFFEA
jgi:hypothetical protein